MLKITIETDGETKVIELGAEEQKAFEAHTLNPVNWIEKAVRDRIGKAIDWLVDNESDLNFKKISIDAKLAIVKDTTIKSAKVRNDEMEAEMGEEG